MVKWPEVGDLFQKQLANIWLNDNEIKDFRAYRDKKFDKDKTYFIWFKTDLDPYIWLTWNIKPDKILRVLMESIEVNEKFDYSKVNILNKDSNIYNGFDRNADILAVELKWTNQNLVLVK